MPTKEYRGRLSTGCERCRAKRIKCDSAKPECNKCKRAGTECQYRDLFEITFRNENPRAAERAQKTWRARVRPKSKPENEDEDMESSSSSSSDDMSMVSTARTSVSPLISLDIMDCAVNRFFFDYVLPEARPGTGLRGVFEYLPPLFYQAPPNSSFKSAIYAVSLANFDRRTGCSISTIRGDIDKHYGRTLQLVRDEAQNPKTAGSTELLLAVQMLGIFESMSTGGNNALFLQAHAMGIAALLKQRRHSIFTDVYHWGILRSINAQLLVACLRLGVASFIPYSELKEIYETAPFPLLRIQKLIHQGVDLLALWKAAVAANDDVEKARLVLQLSALDAEFEEWEQQLPKIAQFSCYPTPDPSSVPKWLRLVLEHPGMPKHVHEYDSTQIIYLWTLYRSTRIMVGKVLLMASLLRPIDGKSVASRQAVIVRMLEDACASIYPIYVQSIDTKPYAQELQDVVGFRPMMAIMPLKFAQETIRQLPETPDRVQRRDWIDMVLKFTMTKFHNARWTC